MIRKVPTPARASSPASAEPVAPHPTMATCDSASFRCPCLPMPWNRICREYRSSDCAPNFPATCRGVSRSVSRAKEVTSPKPQNLYYKWLGREDLFIATFQWEWLPENDCRKMIPSTAVQPVVFENQPMNEDRPG